MDLVRSRGEGEAFSWQRPEGKCQRKKTKGILKEESE